MGSDFCIKSKKILRKCLLLTLLFILIFTYWSQKIEAEEKEVYLDPDSSVEERTADLLSRMTLEEKVGQMVQIDTNVLHGHAPYMEGHLNHNIIQEVLVEHKAGSLLSGGDSSPENNTPRGWAEMVNLFQEYAVEETRLGIPVLFGIDAVHGHNNVPGATIFPHNIGLSDSWNVKLAEEIARATAEAVRATGIHWNFAPVADLGRDLRWGRYYETFGEDVYLTGEFATAISEGLQGTDLALENNVAATGKHFVGYSQPLTGFDRQPADMSLRYLREFHLPPFEKLVDSDVAAVMVNSGSVNGVPVHSSSFLLTEVLRNIMGFEGIVISDWADVRKLYETYFIAGSYKEAIEMTVNAGVDMVMEPYYAGEFVEKLIELVKEEQVSEERIDEAVGRILNLKFALGLFENPYVEEEQAEDIVQSSEHRELARRAARESMTLLENEGLLPLDKDIDKIAVIGPGADNMAMQCGGWTINWQGAPQHKLPSGNTVLDGVQEKLPEAEIYYNPVLPKVGGSGASLNAEEFSEDVIAHAVQDAQKADKVIIVLGEEPYAEGEGDVEQPELSSYHAKLIEAISEVNDDIVLVLLAGRPLVIEEEIIDALSAFLMAYLPGSEGGKAVADIIFGDYNPSGKLTSSWPRNVGQLPLYYNSLRGSKYNPLYEFGYGLSYTTFDYRDINIEGKNEVEEVSEEINITLRVKNTGEMAGSEVVPLFLEPGFTSILPPSDKLVAFEKIYLEPGEEKEIEFNIPLSKMAIIEGDIIGNEKLSVISRGNNFHFGGNFQ